MASVGGCGTRFARASLGPAARLEEIASNRAGQLCRIVVCSVWIDRIVGVVQVWSEHHFEVRAVLDRKAHVCHRQLQEAGGFGLRTRQLVGELEEAFDGDGGQQTGLVAKVVHRRGVRNANAPRELAQAERRRPLVIDHLHSGVDEGAREIAVVVRARGRAVGSSHVGASLHAPILPLTS